MPIDEQNPESAEFTDSEEQVEQELSLEQLSEAYAKVIRERKGEDESDGGEELRMKYRYLDIRRDAVKNNIAIMVKD